jgi:hypothetical protein
MNRALRVVTVVLLAFVAMSLVVLTLVMNKVIANFPMSFNGSDPALARVGLWVLAVGYILLAAVTATLLLPADPGPLRRLRVPVLVVAVIVHFVLVLTSLMLAGWAGFAVCVTLLSLLTAAMLADGEPSRADRSRRAARAGRAGSAAPPDHHPVSGLEDTKGR